MYIQQTDTTKCPGDPRPTAGGKRRLEMSETRCNACGESFPGEFIVDRTAVNTGGDTICACCHLECVPDDADVVGEQAKRQATATE